MVYKVWNGLEIWSQPKSDVVFFLLCFLLFGVFFVRSQHKQLQKDQTAKDLLATYTKITWFVIGTTRVYRYRTSRGTLAMQAFSYFC